MMFPSLVLKEEETMKKLKRFLGKRVFGKGSHRPPAFRGATLGEFLDAFYFVGRFFTAGAGSRGVRPGRLGVFFFCPAAPKKFGRAVPLQIGGAPTRTLSPRRWAMPSGMSPQSGRSMIEMLAVLAIIGVLSITALVGFTYAMNKHRANTIYNDVHLLALHVMDTGKDTVPADFYPDSGKTFTLDTTTYADGFVVKVAAVSEKVCDRIIEVNDPSIEKIYVGNEETTSCSGTQDMGFMFLYDGTFTSGGGSSGGSSGSSGSGTDPVDPCEGIIASTDCSISADETDSNGCVTVKKITCTGDTYCSGTTCEPCPAAETCDGESCCALTGPNDVCGRPTKEVGTVTTVTHSDLNANGCCETTTEESCSFSPVTPRTCTPTCDGTCESDGSCQKVCEANTYGPDCLPCGSGAVSDGTTATCACDTENGFTGTWTAPATGSDDNGCTQGSTCETNANCKSGYFCAFEDPTSCSNQGTGACELISAYAPDSTTAAGFIRSEKEMKWWSAQYWCSAQEKIPATRASIGCSGVENGVYCRSSTVDMFKYTWGGSDFVWLEDYGNGCHSYNIHLSSGGVDGNPRSNYRDALCQ